MLAEVASDILITGGTIIDGSGAPGVSGDVLLRDGRVLEVGRLQPADPGVRVLDATARIICPGFIDLHTHYDAQVTWDPLCSPSPDHGTTTVVMGNCGYSLAPVRPEDRDYLMGLFSAVEQVSKETLEEGVPWEWQSLAEYLSWLESRGIGVNVVPQVGHSALRRYVMGEAAHTREADEGEVAQMLELLRASLEAGAAGFTTSRVAHQRGEHGEPIPSFVADESELFALAAVLAERGRGMVGINPRTKAREFSQADRDQLEELARRSGRPVLWNEFNQRSEYPEQWRSLLDFMEGAQRRGSEIYAVMRCQRMDLSFNLRETGFFNGARGWRDFMALPLAERRRKIQEPAQRELLAGELATRFEGAPGWFKQIAVATPALERNRGLAGRLLTEIASRDGGDPGALLLELAAEENLATEFVFQGVSNNDPEAIEAMLRSPATLTGISDAGAHLHTFCGVDFPTHMLATWVRERAAFSLEEAIAGMTSIPARVAGLANRGILRPGAAADVCVFDPAVVAPEPLELLHDLPGGESRQVKRARGVDWVIVNGEVLLERGKPTGALPGQVIRA